MPTQKTALAQGARTLHPRVLGCFAETGRLQAPSRRPAGPTPRADRPRRRSFTADYKLRILTEFAALDGARQAGNHPCWDAGLRGRDGRFLPGSQ